MKNYLRNILLLLIVCITSCNAFAQNDSLKIDSLKKVLVKEKGDTNKINTLNELSKSVVQDRSNAMQYAKQALTLSQKLDFKNGEGLAYYNYAVALAGSDYVGERGSFEDVVKYYNNAIYILKKTGNQSGLADCYLGIAHAYYSFKQDRGGFIQNTLTALHIYETIDNKQGLAKCFESLCSMYYEIYNYSTAIKYANDAFKIYVQISDSAGIAGMSNLLGSLYLENGDDSTSLKKQFYALKIYQSLGNRAVDYGIPYTYGNIGDIYTREGDTLQANGNKEEAIRKYYDALKYYELRLQLEQQGKMSPRVSYAQLGYLHVALSKVAGNNEAKLNLMKARGYYEKMLQFAKETNQKEFFLSGYYSLSVIDTLSGNYKQAYEHYRLYITYRDSLTNEETTKKTVQANMQYDFDKKESIAKVEQDKKDADAKRIKNQQYFAIGALGVVVLAVVIIALIQFKNNRQKQKANNLITKQKQQVEATLTELKSTQQQLIQSEKMASLGELTAGIAHEIQNPLNFVNNFSEVNKELIEELKIKNEELKIEDKEVNEILNDLAANEEKINHHGKRADAIVKGMLQHSRSSVGAKEPTDINALADEYLRLSFHGMRAKDKDFNATLNTDFDESVGDLNIIAQDISRVLLNLYNNAFYAVSEKSKVKSEMYKPVVSVKTKKEANRITVTVSDNGNGIPQKIIEKIFQPFFTTKPTGQGTGLGLSLSYDIVKAHGGEIKVESKEGEGTVFIIQLPM